ncbi:hypothetical protein LCGC14_0610030 [marine sediment metagenome]|uniref:Uncharacterized protein n=1 Tax=marine sediment metagenome TaxID=412755 RepID=A0A0F9R7Z4_9ZZZZ
MENLLSLYRVGLLEVVKKSPRVLLLLTGVWRRASSPGRRVEISHFLGPRRKQEI